jgi:hypothetical protein
MERRIKYVAVAVKWFDRVNGNTYHSVRITRCRDGKTIYCPYQYGGSDCYRQTALAAMSKAKWLPPKYRQDAHAPFRYEMDNNYPIDFTVSYGLKRDCIANGQA